MLLKITHESLRSTLRAIPAVAEYWDLNGYEEFKDSPFLLLGILADLAVSLRVNALKGDSSAADRLAKILVAVEAAAECGDNTVKDALYLDFIPALLEARNTADVLGGVGPHLRAILREYEAFHHS